MKKVIVIAMACLLSAGTFAGDHHKKINKNSKHSKECTKECSKKCGPGCTQTTCTMK